MSYHLKSICAALFGRSQTGSFPTVDMPSRTFPPPDNWQKELEDLDQCARFLEKMLSGLGDTLEKPPHQQKGGRVTSKDSANDLREYLDYMRLERRKSLNEDYPRVVQELEMIRQLPPNWDSYGGIPPSGETVEHAYSVLGELKTAVEVKGMRLPEPDVSPGAKGTIQFEWDLGQKAFELSFQVVHRKPRYEYLLCPEDDDNTWEEGEFTGDVTRTTAVSKFVSWIQH